MRVYEGSIAGYEEMREQYPNYYRGIREMEALWRAYGIQIDNMRKAISQVIDSRFILRADSESLTELEKWFGVPFDASKSIEERRATLIALKIGNGHIGASEIKTIVSLFLPGIVDVAFAAGVITVAVTQEKLQLENLSLCERALLKKYPHTFLLNLICF